MGMKSFRVSQGTDSGWKEGLVRVHVMVLHLLSGEPGELIRGEGRIKVCLAPEFSTPGTNQSSSFSSCVILINNKNMVCVWRGWEALLRER